MQAVRECWRSSTTRPPPPGSTQRFMRLSLDSQRITPVPGPYSCQDCGAAMAGAADAAASMAVAKIRRRMVIPPVVVLVDTVGHRGLTKAKAIRTPAEHEPPIQLDGQAQLKSKASTSAMRGVSSIAISSRSTPQGDLAQRAGPHPTRDQAGVRPSAGRHRPALGEPRRRARSGCAVRRHPMSLV